MRALLRAVRLAIALSPSAVWGELHIETTLTPAEVWIGDAVQWILSLDRPADTRLELPDFKDLLPGFEIRDMTISETELRSGIIRTTLTLHLVSFDPGDYTIPPARFLLHSEKPGRAPQEFRSRQSAVKVRSLLDSNRSVAELRGPKPQFMLHANRLWLVAVFLALAFLASVLWIAWRRTRTVPAQSAHALARLSPGDEALLGLERLSQSEAFKLLDMKAVFTELSFILRRYLERRYGVLGLEMTSYELLRELKGKRLQDGILERIRTILGESDLVKFARHQPDASGAFTCIENTRHVVVETRETDKHQQETAHAA